MGDVVYTTVYYAPVPDEQFIGLGVAGPPAVQPEEEVQEVSPDGAVQKESAEYSDEAVGRNIDIEA